MEVGRLSQRVCAEGANAKHFCKDLHRRMREQCLIEDVKGEDKLVVQNVQWKEMEENRLCSSKSCGIILAVSLGPNGLSKP